MRFIRRRMKHIAGPIQPFLVADTNPYLAFDDQRLRLSAVNILTGSNLVRHFSIVHSLTTENRKHANMYR
ncbi:hypothetical protein CI15_21320 [Paraburkholderia monticola]|uniref:Uncharacterized protein n=1 Tax=Paraburkholderia monticola TaxID=1399968 RepID=A0A149PIF3_9BURK|nr:hypothetical protein CI15_21320 [Paraburkholderia monticola]